jgi:hypothetical protein
MNLLKKIKTLLAVALVSGSFAAPALVTATAFAATSGTDNINQGLCGGSNLTFESAPCEQGQATGRLSDIITVIINVVSIVVGVVAVIMIIFGGLKYVTSGGESSNVSSAKNTILYAIIGLVVVALAQFIVKFVLDKSINGPGAG